MRSDVHQKTAVQRSIEELVKSVATRFIEIIMYIVALSRSSLSEGYLK